MTVTSLFRLSLFVACLGACVSGDRDPLPWSEDAGAPTDDASNEAVLPGELVDPDPLGHVDDIEETVLDVEVALGGQLSDVAGHPAEEEIRALSDRGFIAGFPDGTFRPNAAVTRAQFAAMVDSAFLADRPAARASFPDVPSSHWAAGAIGRAHAAGFLRGYPDGAFRPDQTITRVEVVVSLANGLGFSQGEWRSTAGRFTDSASVADWARASVANADAEGMFSNARLHQGRLQPTQAASRGVVASYVYLAQVLVIACNASRSECQFDEPRNKAVVVVGGVVVSVYAVAAIWTAAVALAYINSRPGRPTFGQQVSDLRRLSPRQLATAMSRVTPRTCPSCGPPRGETTCRQDCVGPSAPHAPCPGDHLHRYEPVMNQNPETCACFERILGGSSGVVTCNNGCASVRASGARVPPNLGTYVCR